MNTLALKCLPFVIAGLAGLAWVGNSRADNVIVLCVQLYAWVVLIVHVPVLVAVLVWRFVQWELALAERRRVSDAIRAQGEPRVFSSFIFINGCACVVLGLGVLVLIGIGHAGLRHWLEEQGALSFAPELRGIAGTVSKTCLVVVLVGVTMVGSILLFWIQRVFNKLTAPEQDPLRGLREWR